MDTELIDCEASDLELWKEKKYECKSRNVIKA